MTLRPRFSLHRATILRAAYVTLVPALGLTAGTWITLSSPFRDLPGWPAWASLAIVLTTAAGAVFVYGLERWVELRELQVIRTRDVAHPIVGVVTLAVLLLSARCRSRSGREPGVAGPGRRHPHRWRARVGRHVRRPPRRPR